MKKIYLLLAFFVSCIAANAQQPTNLLYNPSLEGISQTHQVPSPWVACFGSPDTQPGQWGITKPASDGNTYVSFLHSGSSSSGYSEGMSQGLEFCLVGGVTYTLIMDLAFSDVYNTAEPGDCYGSFEFYGGNASCGTDELLWQSGMITDTSWQTYTVNFTPSSDLCYITFRPYWIGACTGYINCLVDNMWLVDSLTGYIPGFTIDEPEHMSEQSCTFTISGTMDSVPSSIVVSGNFVGSPANATLLTDTTWELEVNYSGFSGIDSIHASAYYTDITRNRFVFVDITSNAPTPDICLVSVDSATQKNIVVWEKPISQSIDHYTIYREGNQTGVYNAIGTVDYDSLSMFIDTTSIPEQNANSYKLSLTDICDIESDLSTYHKTIHLSINLGLNNTVNLIWNHYEGLSISSYNIYRGSSSANMTLLNTVASNLNSYTDLNPQNGLNYYLIEAIHPNGCVPSRNFSSSISNINGANVVVTGIDEGKQIQFSVYPNPADNVLNVNIPALYGTTTYALTNVLGQQVLNGNITSTNHSIDLSVFASGTYFLELSNGNDRGIKKIIVE